MGGDLSAAPAGETPTFMMAALKDPDGANLDRVQIIKGWRDVDGELHEHIYNVAVSDGRTVGPDGSVEPVGSTFYYVRVLEIPTPRWTAYDAKYFGTEGIPEEVPVVSQERVYTSPIWHTPSSGGR